MKKVLFATTALVLTAGMAVAEVKLSGTARAGLTYAEDSGDREVQVSYRLRLNIDASKELDSGVTLGGRIRLQYDAGDQNASGLRANDGSSLGSLRPLGEGGAELSAAYIYAETGGFRVEVGNANGALDSMATLFNSELGFIGTTQGSYNLLSYADFSSSPYRGDQANTIGIFASYEVGGLVARISYHTPDQTSDDVEEEYSVSVDYTSGAFSVGAGYVFNGGYVDGNDGYVLTGEYAVNDTTNIGLQVLGTTGDASDDDTGVTLYGSTEFSGVTLGAFISYTDADITTNNAGVDVPVENDVAYGIGAKYDLGGAELAGTIQYSYAEEIYADVGINFSF